MTSYHSAEGSRDELVMADLSVHREPSYQNHPTAPNHCEEPAYQPYVREQQQQQQQHPAQLHHPQHQHTVQQQEHQPQPAAPPQGLITSISPKLSYLYLNIFVESYICLFLESFMDSQQKGILKRKSKFCERLVLLF